MSMEQRYAGFLERESRKATTEMKGEVMRQAARLLLENDRENTRLRLEVYALQEALNFWLPCVSVMDSKCAERIASDAGLLAGYSGDLEETAEAAGWITLTANAEVSGGGTPSAGLPGYAAGGSGERE